MTDIDWDELGFDFIPTDKMFVSKADAEGNYDEGKLVPFGPIELSPAACVLNYGQGVFEGMKAQHTKEGKIVLFRPLENGKRIKSSSERLAIPPYDPEKYVEAVKMTVKANKGYIPPYGKGALYVRPILFGSGPVLGVAPAPEYTFLIYVVPVGPYYKEGFNPIKLEITTDYHRAAPKGTGAAKAIGNYAGSLIPGKISKSKGYAQEVYLDAANEKYIEEVGTANFFCILDEVLVTPRLTGSILPGVTRKSVMKIAEERLEMDVEERNIAYEEVFNASEAFCTGTAAVITPIGSITYKGEEHVFNDFKVGETTQKLYDLLRAIQRMETDDPHNWVEIIE
ncbi:MAG: branched-chain amino acid aminotransferase [Candidatus Lokiarchaeota archaeon]|nr:branched-chain amino acid aminotransferase [Candidatus Lokiarchaeota archaeon]